MRYTTLCYLENPAGEYLMLHRVKKENDCNRDKWIGIGGKFLDGESPEECALREIKGGDGADSYRLSVSGDRHLCLRPVGNGIYAPVHRHGVDRPGSGRTAARECWGGSTRIGWRPCPSGTGDRIFLELLRQGAPFFLTEAALWGGDAGPMPA